MRAAGVLGLIVDGGYARWLAAPERCFYRVPDDLEPALAAVYHCTAGTAFRGLGRAGVKAGQSKEEIQKLPALKGFEDNVSPNARLTMAFVLGIAYDEVTAK